MNKKFVSNLKLLQIVGTIVAILFGLITMGVSGNPILGILLAVLLVFANYMTTQFFISVIDLLIRIEEHTKNITS